MLPTRPAPILSVIAQELRARTKELNLEVVELTPQEVRQAVVWNPKATKIDVVDASVQGGFEQLRELLPTRPARAALGMRPRDKYSLHMFDALGLAVAAMQIRREVPSPSQIHALDLYVERREAG